MNDFEKECSKVDISYSGEMSEENVIEWIRGSKIATLTLANHTRQKSELLKLANDEDVQICAINKDGSVVAHIPSEWVHIRKPKKMNFSEEELQKKRDRMKKLHTIKN